MESRDGVEAHLRGVLGTESGRASVTFVGLEAIDVLRFGPDGEGLVRYVTVGGGASLVLTLRGGRDAVARSLAVASASPFVESAVVAPGASLDLGEPLWPGSRFTAFLVGEPGVVPDVGETAFHPLVPMTANEAAFQRVRGAAALEERWLAAGADPRDPDRAEVALA